MRPKLFDSDGALVFFGDGFKAFLSPWLHAGVPLILPLPKAMNRRAVDAWLYQSNATPLPLNKETNCVVVRGGGHLIIVARYVPHKELPSAVELWRYFTSQEECLLPPRPTAKTGSTFISGQHVARPSATIAALSDSVPSTKRS